MQKAFAFNLTIFYIIIALFVGCKPNPNLQGKGEGYLQGEWQQDSVPKQKLLLQYSLYHLKFNCDSFFVQISSVSKVNNGADTCMNSGHWSEYIKGSYQQHNDTLHLRGQFCNSDYSLKPEGGCFRSGIYDESFLIHKKADSLIQFSSTSNVIPINAHLIKHITCNPKPL